VALRAVVLRLRLCDNNQIGSDLTLHALFTPQETRIAVIFLGALSDGLSVTSNKEDGGSASAGVSSRNHRHRYKQQQAHTRTHEEKSRTPHTHDSQRPWFGTHILLRLDGASTLDAQQSFYEAKKVQTAVDLDHLLQEAEDPEMAAGARAQHVGVVRDLDLRWTHDSPCLAWFSLALLVHVRVLSLVFFGSPCARARRGRGPRDSGRPAGVRAEVRMVLLGLALAILSFFSLALRVRVHVRVGVGLETAGALLGCEPRCAQFFLALLSHFFVFFGPPCARARGRGPRDDGCPAGVRAEVRMVLLGLVIDQFLLFCVRCLFFAANFLRNG
jgi:hypothetical protein